MRAWTKKVSQPADAEAMLDGYRDRYRIPHRLYAIGNQLRLRHQAGAKRAVLHALGWTAAVQVDFVVTVLLAQAGAMRERRRIRAAQLQCDRMLGGIEAQVPFDVAMDQRPGRHHLGVHHGMIGNLPEEITAMPVRPVHHRRRAEAVVKRRHANMETGGVVQRRRYSTLMPNTDMVVAG